MLDGGPGWRSVPFLLLVPFVFWRRIGLVVVGTFSPCPFTATMLLRYRGLASCGKLVRERRDLVLVG